MHFDDDGNAWILDDPSALIGWRVLWAEPWKPGVVRLHLVRLNGDGEFRLVYASEDHAADLAGALSPGCCP